MSGALEFRISRRHYDLVIDQAKTNMPQESGGFFGGVGCLISAVLPSFNQHMADKTGTFSVTSDDIARAHAFFEKHKLEYYGVYHTHPNAEAYPSTQDIKTGQKYHFIVGLADMNNIQFNAFQIINNQVYPLPFIVMEDKHFSVVDIHAKSSTTQSSEKAAAEVSLMGPHINRDPKSEEALLGSMLDNIRKEKPEYSKLPPRSLDSDFSTLA